MADEKLKSDETAGEAAQGRELGRVEMVRPDWRISLLIVAIAIGIYVPVMGSYGMFDPWETHYTEVARQFMERNDWLDTHWHNGTGPEGFSERHFWSKPVGSFWLSGLSLKLLGFQDKITLRGARAGKKKHDPGEYITTGSVEWAVRLPFFLCALFGIFAVYLMVTRLFGRRAGFFSGVVLATAPMYFMIGRQAMTDMPYVGLMSGGLAFFILGMFGHREELPTRKQFTIKGRVIDWPHSKAYYLFLLSFVLVMVLQLRAVVGGLLRVQLFKVGNASVSAAILMTIWVALALVFIWLSRKTTTRNEIYLYIFYMVVAMGGWSKGLVAALQPGLVVLVYILASREWYMLRDAALLRGLILAATVFAPWFHGMLLRYGKSWWNELFGTEQLRRLTVGEQKQAKGTWEYYIQQIGYGLFPWVAFLPAALVRAVTIGTKKERTAEERARLFIYLWFAAALLLFTLTITKYHHYILPAIPPAAIIIGIYLDDLLKKKAGSLSLAALAAVTTLTIVGIDMVKQPAHWVWMYTYLYNGNWARGVPPGVPNMLVYTLVFGVLMLLVFLPRGRNLAAYGLVVCSIVIGGYVLNWHQTKCAPHWSQKYVLKSYYKLRKGPEEEIVAWQFNWRGETWYTAAQVVVAKSLDNTKIKKWLKERQGRKFYFITERSRFSSLRHMMPTPKGKKTLKIVDDSNVHYVLAEAQI